MTASMVAEVRRRFGVPVVVRYTSTESSLGTGTTLTSSDDEVATTVGPPGGRGRAHHRRRRREARPRRLDRTRPPALRRPPCAATGAAVRGGVAAVDELLDAGPRRPCSAPDGWLTTGDFGLAHPRGEPAAVGPGPRALHPGRLQRLPGRGRGGPLVAPGRGPGRRGRGARRRPRRNRRGRRGRRGGRDSPSLPRCAPTAPGRSPTTRPRTRWWSSTSCPLTPMMKVDPVRLAALAARAAEQRRAALARNRRPGAGVLGSGPTADGPTGEVGREGACMSPTTRVGESDPNRGTAPEAITPGRYTGRVALVTGAGLGHRAGHGAPAGRRGRRPWPASTWPRTPSRPWRPRSTQEAAEAGGRAIALRCDVTDEDAVAAAWPGPRGAGPHHQPVQHRRHRRVRPHARPVPERLGQDHRRQPDGHLPHVPGRAAGHARARRGHREHGLDGRRHRPALLGGVLRLEGRRQDAHQGAGGRVHGARCPRERRGARRRRHADHPQLRAARRRRLQADRAIDDADRLRLSRTRSPARSPTSARTRPTT